MLSGTRKFLVFQRMHKMVDEPQGMIHANIACTVARSSQFLIHSGAVDSPFLHAIIQNKSHLLSDLTIHRDQLAGGIATVEESVMSEVAVGPVGFTTNCEGEDFLAYLDGQVEQRETCWLFRVQYHSCRTSKSCKL